MSIAYADLWDCTNPAKPIGLPNEPGMVPELPAVSAGRLPFLKSGGEIADDIICFFSERNSMVISTVTCVLFRREICYVFP